ncbi:glucose 1-dehydrogenase [candidate division KSB3 bacterium]|jgi:NAD(P)-dependent dehydrogenase (short-subunit alcohol dehydrogenase family)|uniref:Glucose 1-dehydrogenase n=1 Tax=candidate division KSB3 bacterium TaxID=2044937 RepID=A0A9D5Q7I3_9BACT|nr:glucose 1-dehydrogenase [candidate division KSB3 bacterium]MBD3326473.1 glucose 1-dehydrogenase [candidate division KSB3 bacterium]
MRHQDRVAIVTGGGNGIGQGICEYMAKLGGKIVVADIDLDAAQQVVKNIQADGGDAMALKVDVTQKAATQAMAADVLKTYGQIDILVNNAGTDKKGAITELEESTWDMLMTLNLKGVFLCTQAVMTSMIERQYGRVVNIASMAGKTGEPFTSPYCATKFGVIGFTQSVALEVGKYNVTINAVCPGPVDTELIRQSVAQSAKIKGMTPEDFLQEFFIAPTPLGRIAKPLDVARAVSFLASDEAEFITGSTLNVSGGREMH